MLEGIDVSKWQGTPNWKSVAATDKKYVVARSTIGKETKDATFVANYQGARAAGLVPGAYHVVTGDSSGKEQAANFKDSLTQAGYDKGLLVLDVERDDGATPAQVLNKVEYLCNFIRDTYNRTPIIYTGYFWRDNLKQPTDNFGALLWLAAYVQDPSIWVPKAWSSWTIWQYSSSGKVDGINDAVDLDKYDGTLRDLRVLAGWEWDELATKDEIRAIVHDEVAALLAVDNTNTDRVVNIVNTSTGRVLDKVAAIPTTTTAKVDLTPVTSKLDAGFADVDESIRSTATQTSVAVMTGVAGALNDFKRDITDGQATLASNNQQVLDLLQALTTEVGNDPAAADIQSIKDLVTRLHQHLCLPCVAERQGADARSTLAELADG